MTKADVAQWMVEEAEKGTLYQEEAVFEIERKFGPDFVYTNDSGGQGIDKGVLRAFRKLTPHLVWDRSERAWREREPYDGAGRQVD